MADAVDKFDKPSEVDSILCDVSMKEHRYHLFEHIKNKYGRIDVLFLNAAVVTHVGK